MDRCTLHNNPSKRVGLVQCGPHRHLIAI